MIKEVEPLDKVKVYVLRNFVLVAEVLDPLDSSLDCWNFLISIVCYQNQFSLRKKLMKDLEIRESKVKDNSGQTKYTKIM